MPRAAQPYARRAHSKGHTPQYTAIAHAEGGTPNVWQAHTKDRASQCSESTCQGPHIAMLDKYTPRVAQPDSHTALVRVAYSHTNVRQVHNPMPYKYTPRVAQRGTHTILARTSRPYTNARQLDAKGSTGQCTANTYQEPHNPMPGREG